MAVIALDLGGSKLAAALFSEDGDLIHLERTTLDERRGSEVGDLILQQSNALLRHAASANLPVQSLGICVPGIAYAKSGSVWAPNIPAWDNYPLREHLQAELADQRIAIRIDSDRSCYILGEVWKGNAKGCKDAIFIAVGTGIGAGILSNGHVIRGTGDIAGAVGWLALSKPFHDKYISCGCFEYHASGEGLSRVAGELSGNAAYSDSVLPINITARISAKDVFEAYSHGDELAIAVVSSAIGYWGMTVANLVSIFNPEKIIFGGGVFGPALQFLDAIYAEAKKWAQPISMTQVKLEGSALGSHAGLYGAGYLALNT